MSPGAKLPLDSVDYSCCVGWRHDSVSDWSDSRARFSVGGRRLDADHNARDSYIRLLSGQLSRGPHGSPFQGASSVDIHPNHRRLGQCSKETS